MTEADVLLANTRRCLARFESVVGSLDRVEPALKTTSGWTIAGTLGHLAFWDDWVRARWTYWLGGGGFHDLPDDLTDLVNAAGQRAWEAIRPDRAKSVALEAAQSVVQVLDQLPTLALQDALSTGRFAMVDRSIHWEPHLNEIETARLLL
jgi:hypothetical protein